MRRRFLARPTRRGNITLAPVPAEYLLQETNVTTVDLPTWDDSQGTAFLDDGAGTKRAISWGTGGYTLSENGSTVAQYPPAWDDPTQSSPGDTYYVDASTGTSGVGTIGDPLKLISDIPALSAGDSVLFKKGETWTETLTLTSGSSGNVIYYGSYGSGADPIIDAALTRTTCISLATGSNIWIKGLDCRRATRACLRFTGDTVSNVTIEDCTFRDSRYDGIYNSNGVQIEYSDNVRLRNCVAHNNGGVGFYWGYFQEPNRHTNVVFCYCTLYDNGKQDPSNDTNFHANSGWLSGQAYGNETYDNGTPASMWYYDRQSPNTADVSLHDNVFHDAGGGNAGVLQKSTSKLFRNVIYNPNHIWGVSNDQPNGVATKLWHHHNVLMDNKSGGFNVQSSDDKEISGGSFDIYTWNNTIDKCSQTSSNYGGINWLIVDTPTPSGESRRAKNNIISNSGNRNFTIWSTSFGVEEVDYNFYYNESAANPFLYGGSLTNFASWQGFGFDTNGSNGVNPSYVDATSAWDSRDYGLQAGSGALSAGTDAVYDMTDPNSWIGINFVPHATSPDCGAYQYLSGKTLDFSKYFLGMIVGTAAEIIIAELSRSAAEINTWTAPADNAIWEDGNNAIYEDDNNAVWE